MFTFPVTVLEFHSLIGQGFDDGIIGFGVVQRIVQEGVVHYAIRDGGWWSHPGLQPFLGERVGINLNFPQRRIEVTQWPAHEQKLAILGGDGYITIWTWLLLNPGVANTLRSQIARGAVSLVHGTFREVANQTVVVSGLVQFTQGFSNGLGLDAEVIQVGKVTFFSRDMPELLPTFIGQEVIILVEDGRLTVVPLGGPEG